MSLVQVRVELPAYGHSFLIEVPSTSTIADVKQEISITCPGRPRVSGQRIIWQGRYLVDHEKVEDLWKSPDDPRIVHLSVHPSAWESSPPEIPSPAQPQSLISQMNIPQERPRQPPRRVRSQPSPTIIPNPHPLAYILFKHQTALAVLFDEPVSSIIPTDQEVSRTLALHAVESQGWIWPPILDEQFPATTDGGVKYERITASGQNYLSLVTPFTAPTPRQRHAIQVLTYTFTLLSIPVSQTVTTRSATPPQPIPIPPNVNQLLQQMGLPQIRPVQNPNPNQNQNQNQNQNPVVPGLRDLPFRPLLAPMFLIFLRTLLILYFIAPARKPFLGVLVLAWILYEVWQPIRNMLIRGLRAAAAEEQQQQPAPANQEPQVQPAGAANPQPNPAAEAPRPPQNRPAGAQAPIFELQVQVDATAVLNTVANVNIPAEELIINEAPGTDTSEPSLSHKLAVFFSLLVTTIHPAVWNARRAALRPREGRIRTEANIRDAPVDTTGEESDNRIQLRNQHREQHNRRPRWIRDYIDRVVAAEWVDDSD